MRIIGGELKGRKFSVPGHFPVRPTTDYAREALFNILSNRVDFESLAMLDLFCGTGSISLEAWSRGCRNITAVDKHAGCCKYLAQLIQRFELKGINVQKEGAIEWVKKSKLKFDLVFADPPYDFPHYEELLNLLLNNNILNEDALVVIEHGNTTNLQLLPGYEQTRQYGSVHFSFISKNKK